MIGRWAEVVEEWAEKPLSDRLAILRDIRKDSGLTLAEVGRRAGLSVAYLSMLERGEYSTIRIETLEKIASACGCFLRIEIVRPTRATYYGIV